MSITKHYIKPLFRLRSVKALLAAILLVAATATNTVSALDIYYPLNEIVWSRPSNCTVETSGISTSAVATGDGIYNIAIKNPSGKQFHGNNYEFENSLNGVEHAHKGGFHAIDLDINKTTDGVLFAQHSGKLFNKSWSAIEKLNTTRRYKVSKLSDLLAKTAEYGLQANLDIKKGTKWNDATFSELANLANSLKAKVTVKASTEHKELADALLIAQKHGFWVRSNKNPYAGNGWKAGVWHKPTTSPTGSSTDSSITPIDSTSSSGNIRIGSYNAAGVTMQGGSLGGLGSAQRHFESGMKIEEENNATIVMIQEAAKNLKAPSGWQMYFHKFGNRTVAIAWKSNVWKPTAKDILNVDNSKESPKTPDTYYYPYVTLADKNGNEITVMSIHLVSKLRNSPQRPEQAATVKQKVLELAQDGKNVVVGGDFNYQPPALLNDMSPLTPANKNYKGIDHFFGTQGVSFSNWKIDKSTGSFTDHPLVFTDVNVSDTLFNAEAPVSCTCPSPGSEVSSISLRGNGNLEKIFYFFIDKGLSPEQAAGVVGNISQESGGDPTLAQGGLAKNIDDDKPVDKWLFDDKHVKDPTKYGTAVGVGKAWGLIQWDAGGRAIQYAKKAKVEGEIYRLYTQLEITWWHMQTETPTAKRNFIDEYKKITDVRKATAAYEKGMEGAGRPNMVNRYLAAEIAVSQYGGKTSTSSASNASLPVQDCGSTASGAVRGDIIKTALNYAWHDNNISPRTKTKPTYAAAIAIAKAKGLYTGNSCSTSTSKDDGVDCGAFITRVMQDSGVDPNYGGGGNTASQLKYMQDHPKLYEEIHPANTKDLEPGDIAVQNNNSVKHTYMYVGDQSASGFKTTIASASECDHAPWAGLEKPADPAYHWFRYIGSGGVVSV